MGGTYEPGSQPADTQLNENGGGKGGKTKVEAAALKRAAGDLTDVQVGLRKADNKADDAVRDAGRKLNRNGGWRIAAACEDFADRWNGQVKHLHQEMQDLAEKLKGSADAYTKREIEENANMVKIRADFG